MHRVVAEIAERCRFRARALPLARLALLLVLAALTAGCTKLVYNRLDTLAGWFLEELVSLDDSQRADLRSWLQQTLEWHRASELNRYAQFLRGVAAEAAQPGTRASYESTEAQIDQFYEALLAKAAPDAARLLMSLTPAQVGELQAGLEEKSRERSAKSQQALADGTWRAKKEKELQRELKRWTGTVTPEQKVMLHDAAATLESTSTEWLASQQRWRAALRRTLDERESPQVIGGQSPRVIGGQSPQVIGGRSPRVIGGHSPDVVRERILQLLQEPEREWTAEYEARSERNRQRMLTLIQSVDASLTREQRQRLQRKLLQLAEQLEALMEE